MTHENLFKNHSLLILITAIFIVLQVKAGAASENQKDTLGYKVLSIKKGDRCIVCDMPLKVGEGLALLIKGRRVTIDLDHIDEFFANQSKYLAELQPRGALFQESAVLEQTLKSVWFILGLITVLALLSAAYTCHTAMKKGYSTKKWFFIGLVFNIFGILWIKLKSSKQKVDLPKNWHKILKTTKPESCPNCGEFNHPSSKKCSHCGEVLTPREESEVSRAGL